MAEKMVGATGIEPVTPTMSTLCPPLERQKTAIPVWRSDAIMAVCSRFDHGSGSFRTKGNYVPHLFQNGG